MCIKEDGYLIDSSRNILNVEYNSRRIYSQLCWYEALINEIIKNASYQCLVVYVNDSAYIYTWPFKQILLIDSLITAAAIIQRSQRIINREHFRALFIQMNKNKIDTLNRVNCYFFFTTEDIIYQFQYFLLHKQIGRSYQMICEWYHCLTYRSIAYKATE